MSTTVFLVRHGEVHNPDHVVYADIPGFGLSERGQRQAGEAAEYLADRPIAAVCASPLQRATQTASPIAVHHGLVVSTDSELTEWYLTQRWKGLPWDDLPVERPGEVEAYLANPLDMPFSPESLEALAVRMTSAVGRLAALYTDESIVIVSHQDPIQAARLGLLHRTLSSLNRDKPGHAEVFELTTGDPWVEASRFLPAEQETFPPS
jgi:broad specificity phosphatase PhoE